MNGSKQGYSAETETFALNVESHVSEHRVLILANVVLLRLTDHTYQFGKKRQAWCFHSQHNFLCAFQLGIFAFFGHICKTTTRVRRRSTADPHSGQSLSYKALRHSWFANWLLLCRQVRSGLSNTTAIVH